MRSVRVVILAAALAAARAFAAHPVDIPCVHWVPGEASQVPSDSTDLFDASTHACISCSGVTCDQYVDILPCFASQTNTWGHRDFDHGALSTTGGFTSCHTLSGGNVVFDRSMYLPQKGPKWQTWKWVLTQRGAKVPANAIRYGSSVMAKSLKNGPNVCFGKDFTGWAEGKKDGTFGNVYFTTGENPAETNEFQVAVCKAYHPTTTPAPGTTPAPTLPPDNKPYIRFGNTIPTENAVDVVITQGNITFSWNNYVFGQFSKWNELFHNGPGTIQVYDATGGSRGQLYLTKTTLLTPGPLVVVVKGAWPPRNPLTSLETIAASYVPVHIPGYSGVRLFNLAPTVKQAGLNGSSSGALVDHVKYTIGSGWAPVPEEKQQTFTIFDNMDGSTLATINTAPPEQPFVFTIFLIGSQNATERKYTPQAVALIDAPEQD